MGAVAELESKVEKKKKRAIEFDILEKSKKITEILGSHYYNSHCGGGGGLSGCYVFSENGYSFEDNKIRIEAGKSGYDGEEKKDFARIYIFKNALCRLLRLSNEVFYQKGKNIEVFREEGKWADKIEGLFSLSLETEACRKVAQGRREEKGKLEEISANFGFG